MDKKYLINDTLTDWGNEYYQKAPKSRIELAVYIASIWGIKIPNKEICHDSQLNALWGLYANINPALIFLAMRGSGKTFLLALSAVLESIFKWRCGIVVLGGSFEQSRRIVEYMKILWNNIYLPQHMLVDGKINKNGYKLKNGSWVIALTASERSVRGPHPAKLRLDEIDTMSEQIYKSSLGQPKSNFGVKDNIVLSSTLHHPFGLMANVVDNRHENNMKLYQWCYKEMLEPAGFWQEEEIERRRRQMTVEMFAAEYKLERPLPGKSIFNFDQIEYAWENGRKSVFDPNIEYNYGGIDWGYTCTVLNIIQDNKEFITVIRSCTWEFTELVERCNDIIDICLEHKIRHLYCDSAPKDNAITLINQLRRRKLKTVISVTPVAFNKWKDTGIDVIRFMLKNKIIKIQSKTLKTKLQQYHYKNINMETIDKIDDHYCDSLIAYATSKFNILNLAE